MVTPRGEGVAALAAQNMSSDAGAWAPGVTVGNYSLLAKLAVGGMA